MHRLLALLLVLLVAACAASRRAPQERAGPSIVVCGQRFAVDARVVLWSDPGGYDAYIERCHFTPERALPRQSEDLRRYGARRGISPDPSIAEVQGHVHQLVLHYDAAGTSRRCFEILHDVRGLSCHFLLDRDGTIYQTLDLKERAWHASAANDRSVGIEIANMGAYPVRPEGEVVAGTIHGQRLYQEPFTDAQYEALAQLLTALRSALPRLRLASPRTPEGSVPMTALPESEALAFEGLVGHFHLTLQKLDPGPAFDWERLFARTTALQRNS